MRNIYIEARNILRLVWINSNGHISNEHFLFEKHILNFLTEHCKTRDSYNLFVDTFIFYKVYFHSDVINATEDVLTIVSTLLDHKEK